MEIRDEKRDKHIPMKFSLQIYKLALLIDPLNSPFEPSPFEVSYKFDINLMIN